MFKLLLLLVALSSQSLSKSVSSSSSSCPYGTANYYSYANGFTHHFSKCYAYSACQTDDVFYDGDEFNTFVCRSFFDPSSSKPVEYDANVRLLEPRTSDDFEDLYHIHKFWADPNFSFCSYISDCGFWVRKTRLFT